MRKINIDAWSSDKLLNKQEQPVMTIDTIIASGDRVEFKKYIASCTMKQLSTAWIKATKAKVQDFQTLAFSEMTRRG